MHEHAKCVKIELTYVRRMSSASTRNEAPAATPEPIPTVLPLLPMLKARVNSEFPQLAGEGYEIVGSPTDRYNCIAYAAGDASRWWDHNENHHWPGYVSRSNSMESLKQVFLRLEFQPCNDSRMEGGYQKAALYEREGAWEHTAVQMPNGRWRSKMGRGPVIEHQSPQFLSSYIYGEPTTYMRRATDAVS